MSDDPGSNDSVQITVDADRTVASLLRMPPGARGCLILAHGAGAGMTHPFMVAIAEGLARRGIASLRYQFPYMQAGSKRPDRPALAQATVRAAVAAASRLAPGVPLFAGGKSFGGRMTSQAQAAAPLPGVRGLVFLGFPLHPSGKPSDDRAAHLSGVQVPMLFVQGTRDTLAEPRLLVPLVERLGARAKLLAIGQADHSFHVPKRSGRTDRDVLDGILDDVAAWMVAITPVRARPIPP